MPECRASKRAKKENAAYILRQINNNDFSLINKNMNENLKLAIRMLESLAENLAWEKNGEVHGKNIKDIINLIKKLYEEAK